MKLKRTAIFIMFLVGSTSIYALSQTAITADGDDRPITSFRESLSMHNIGLSHDSLASALYNTDAIIRSEAAAVLAENHDPEAISLIKKALASEHDSETSIAFASILMSLGDQTGTTRLASICSDPMLPAKVVSSATFQLILRGGGSQCTDRILNVLKNTSKVQTAGSLIQLLAPLYSVSSNSQQTQIVAVLRVFIADREPETRIIASRALVQVASPNSLQIIKEALQKEEDPLVRAILQKDLQGLPPNP